MALITDLIPVVVLYLSPPSLALFPQPHTLPYHLLTRWSIITHYSALELIHSYIYNTPPGSHSYSTFTSKANVISFIFDVMCLDYLFKHLLPGFLVVRKNEI